MRQVFFLIFTNAAAFVAGYIIVGIIVGRLMWERVEKTIDAETLRRAIDLVGNQLGIPKITSLDSHLAAVGRIVDYLTLPWALLGGTTFAIIASLVLARYRQR